MITIQGAYRVQSRREPCDSELRGMWWRGGGLDSPGVNAWLEAHPLWRGQWVNVRGLVVSYRSGAFAEGDALYYRDHFIPTVPARDFSADLIDVTKLAEHWRRRAPLLRRIFDPVSWALIESSVVDVMRVASDEYHLHEAGHALGWSVQQKVGAGYFRLNGATSWPLVFVEELRADLGSLGAALDLLDARSADAVFLYHLAHRFGLAAESTHRLAICVPFLLFAVCIEQGAIRIDQGSIHVTDGRHGAMRACAELAAGALTIPDVTRVDAVGAAMNAATFVRRYALDQRLVRTYQSVFSSGALSRGMDRNGVSTPAQPTQRPAR